MGNNKKKLPLGAKETRAEWEERKQEEGKRYASKITLSGVEKAKNRRSKGYKNDLKSRIDD